MYGVEHGVDYICSMAWDGAISIRSGTARIPDVPSWDDTPPLEETLPPFPGAQIHIVLPAKGEDHA